MASTRNQLEPEIQQQVGLQVQSAVGASIRGVQNCVAELDLLLTDKDMQALALQIPNLRNHLRSVEAIATRLRRDVHMLETCGDKKRKREGPSDAGEPAKKQSNIANFFNKKIG